MNRIFFTFLFCLLITTGFAQSSATTIKFYSKKEPSKCSTEITIGNQYPFQVKEGEVVVFTLYSSGSIDLSFNQCGPVEQNGVVKSLRLEFEPGKTYCFYLHNGMFKEDWVEQVDQSDFDNAAKKSLHTLSVEEDRANPIK